MKWVNLLWSVVILGFIILFFARISSHYTGPLSPGFAWAAIAEIVIIILSPVILLLRVFRTIKDAGSFGYIFIGTANGVIGITGLYFAARNSAHVGYLSVILFMLNILIGTFIFTDAFLTTIPGYTKTKKRPQRP